MLAGVIFDIDGTLIDSVEGHAKAWVAAFEEHGIAVDLGEVRRQIGKGADQLLPYFLDTANAERVGKAIDARQGEVFKARYLDEVRAFPRVRELFERLRRDGVKCVLGSSGKPADVEQAEAIADIRGLVDGMATSQDVHRSKPSPDIVQAALDRLKPASPSQCLFVGDTPWDAEAAKKAGVMAIGFGSPVFSDDELRVAGCRRVFASIADVLDHYSEVMGLV